MKWFTGVLVLLSIFLFLNAKRHQPLPRNSVHELESEKQTEVETDEVAPVNTPGPVASVHRPVAISSKEVAIESNPSPVIAVSMNVDGQKISIPASQNSQGANAPKRAFEVDEGIAVIDGDIALGNAAHSARQGVAFLPPPLSWKQHQIPYYIQPDVPHPERIRQAIKYFRSTSIQFVESTNEEDVVVFQNALGVCKSYVGRIGGKQPIWIAPSCGAHEIAHEIMHAIGFIHEQNRSDRDASIRVFSQNIEPLKIHNFETMPSTFMALSGLSEFAYDSIMLYPPLMFSINGQPTMEAISFGKRIHPRTSGLSDNDIARINAYFRDR